MKTLKYRKKPVVIEAVQFTNSTENLLELKEFMPGWSGQVYFAAEHDRDSDPFITIKTMEGNMKCSLHWWVIKGVEGEFYPCAPSVFEKTYELEPKQDRHVFMFSMLSPDDGYCFICQQPELHPNHQVGA